MRTDNQMNNEQWCKKSDNRNSVDNGYFRLSGIENIF